MTDNKNRTSPISMQIKWGAFIIPTIVGVALRLLIYIYFSDYLEDNFAFVAPWNSFQRLKDAVALWRNGIGLYAADYHSMPWIALAFAPILDYGFLLLGIFTVFDILSALFTFKFAYKYLLDKSESPSEQAQLVYNIYILNPLGVGICAALSLSSFVNLLLAAALYFNYKRKSIIAVILISLICQFNIYYIPLLFAVTNSDTKKIRKSGRCILVSFLVVVALYVTNGIFANLQDVFDGNIMFFMRVSDHTPNTGNFWYMFTEVFPHYRVFFLFVFQILAFIYAIPFWRILGDSPLTLWFVYLQIVAFGSSYPTYAEFCAYLPLFFVFKSYHKYYRLIYLITTALAISFVTSTITLTQWIQSGSGNANFYFGSCTTYVIALVGLAYETINAHLLDQDVKFSGLSDPNTRRFYLNVPAQRPKKL